MHKLYLDSSSSRNTYYVVAAAMARAAHLVSEWFGRDPTIRGKYDVVTKSGLVKV